MLLDIFVEDHSLTEISSPRFPTPRRALFTAGMMGGMDGRGQYSVETYWFHRLTLGYRTLDHSSSSFVVACSPHRTHGGLAVTAQGPFLHYTDRDHISHTSLNSQ